MLVSLLIFIDNLELDIDLIIESLRKVEAKYFHAKFLKILIIKLHDSQK